MNDSIRVMALLNDPRFLSNMISLHLLTSRLSFLQYNNNGNSSELQASLYGQ